MSVTHHLYYYRKSVFCCILYLDFLVKSVTAKDFPNVCFLFTKDVSFPNYYFPVLFLLSTLISTLSTTNNYQIGSQIFFLILMGMLSIMVAFVCSVLRIYVRNMFSLISCYSHNQLFLLNPWITLILILCTLQS